jgi:hypothetical protein
MKFIKLESRGGNYLVVASNVAWLRTAEKGQTNVGIIGSQPLLVVGSVEEVAEKILNGVKGIDEEEAHAPPPAEPLPAPAPQEVAPPVVEPETVAGIVPEVIAEQPVYAPQPEPEPLPEPAMAAPEPERAAPVDYAEPEPAFTPVRLEPRPAIPIRPRPAASSNAPLWERPVAPAAKGLKIKAGSQRMMGMLE